MNVTKILDTVSINTVYDFLKASFSFQQFFLRLSSFKTDQYTQKMEVEVLPKWAFINHVDS